MLMAVTGLPGSPSLLGAPPIYSHHKRHGGVACSSRTNPRARTNLQPVSSMPYMALDKREPWARLHGQGRAYNAQVRTPQGVFHERNLSRAQHSLPL